MNPVGPTNSDLAVYLRLHRDTITRLWLESVRSLSSTVSAVRTPTLVDHIPDFLERLAREFDPTASSVEATRQSLLFAEVHGAERADLPSYTIAHVLSEYTLLRKTILTTLELWRTLTAKQRDLILDIVDLAKTEAVTMFVERRMEGERRALRETESERDRLLAVATSKGRVP